MYHNLRWIHKWFGLVCCLFLALISLTGFFLALKSNLDWIRPATQKGGEMTGIGPSVSVGTALEAAFAQGIPELASPDDVDRIELHYSKNVYKVTSAKGYHEVQVDGESGKVVSVGKRADQFFEDIHDLSFFTEPARHWVLPYVAAGLFTLSVTGGYMFFVPIYRRWKHKSQSGKG